MDDLAKGKEHINYDFSEIDNGFTANLTKIY